MRQSFAFFAAPTDVVTLCSHVTLDGVAQPVTCADAPAVPVADVTVFDTIVAVENAALVLEQ